MPQRLPGYHGTGEPDLLPAGDHSLPDAGRTAGGLFLRLHRDARDQQLLRDLSHGCLLAHSAAAAAAVRVVDGDGAVHQLVERAHTGFPASDRGAHATAGLPDAGVLWHRADTGTIPFDRLYQPAYARYPDLS